MAVRSGKAEGPTLSNARSRANVDVLFVQSNPSQLDNPFYSLLSNATGRIAVALLNSGAPDRRAIDPELGFVPIFPSASSDAATYMLPSECDGGARSVMRLVMRIRPKLVVVQDQGWRSKVQIAMACRLRGISIAMRSDKNHISSSARVGIGRALEGFVARAVFDQLAPVSTLTAEYYGWKNSRTCWWFPYPTLAKKFAPTPVVLQRPERVSATNWGSRRTLRCSSWSQSSSRARIQRQLFGRLPMRRTTVVTPCGFGRRRAHGE